MAIATTPLDRARQLLDADRLRRPPQVRDGYLDVLDAPPPTATPASRLMRTGVYPLVYQRIRPIGLRVMSGLAEPGRDADRARAAQRLQLQPGQRLLDVACGPGNFTGYFASVLGPDGLAVGLDASTTMLAQAVRDNPHGSAAYVLGDAADLPFPDDTFDAVTCFAALYLMAAPYVALAEAVRVLRPGGRLAILTSFAGRHHVTRTAMRVGQAVSGVRAFGARDITDALADLGLAEIRQEIAGVAQSVWGVKPS